MKKNSLSISLVLIMAFILSIFMVGCDDGSLEKVELSKEIVSLEYDTAVYTGEAIEPSVTIKISEITVPSSDYVVTYSNNIEIGTATVTITAKEDSLVISGSVNKTFTITEAIVVDERVELTESMVALEYSTASYTGLALVPTVIVTIGENVVAATNYDVAYSNNINAGEATVTVTAKLDSTAISGTASKSFTITKAALSESMVALEYSTASYTGLALEPTVIVTIGENVVDATNYDVAYSNNINVGEATVTVTAKSDSTAISGTASKSFTITKAALSESMLTLEYESADSIGLALEPAVLVSIGEEIVPSANYDIAYYDNIEIGEATVTVTAKSDSTIISGTASKNFTITKATVRVTTTSELVSAAQINANIILASDIDNNNEDIDITTQDSVRDLDFTIDLNGFDILAELNLKTWNKGYYNHSITCTITDSSLEKTGSIGSTTTEDVWFGLMVNGGAGEGHELSGMDVTLIGITLVGDLSGIYSNGVCEGANITAEDTIFTSATSIVKIDSAGAYLAGGYTYNFTNCTFEGGSGIYTKSGNHTYTNCVFTGTYEYTEPVYNGNGENVTGSSFVADSNPGYKQFMNIEFNGCTFNSEYGYGIEECSTSKTDATKVSYADITIKGATTYNATKGDYSTQNDVITVISE